MFIRGSVVRYVMLPRSEVDVGLLEDATRRGEFFFYLWDTILEGHNMSKDSERRLGMDACVMFVEDANILQRLQTKLERLAS